MTTETPDFRTWLHKQRNRRDVHGRDLQIVHLARHVARYSDRYPGDWSTPEELCVLHRGPCCVAETRR